MDYNGRIMNINQAQGAAVLSDYATGHRDARHRAAVIALEAQAEIERLRTPLTMQDIRLHAGEGTLSAHTVLHAANAALSTR